LPSESSVYSKRRRSWPVARKGTTTRIDSQVALLRWLGTLTRKLRGELQVPLADAEDPALRRVRLSEERYDQLLAEQRRIHGRPPESGA
jgi:hypothetical protein